MAKRKKDAVRGMKTEENDWVDFDRLDEPLYARAFIINLVLKGARFADKSPQTDAEYIKVAKDLFLQVERNSFSDIKGSLAH